MAKQRLKLSSAVLAALAASGVANASLEEEGTETAAAPAADPAAVAEAAKTPEGEAPATPAPAEATTETAAAPAADPPAPAAAPSPPAPDALVAHLQTELRTAQEKVTSLTVELTSTKARADAAEALQPSFEAIVRTAAQRLSVGLGASAVGFDKLSGQVLVDTFTQLNNDFIKRFPVGGKSSPQSEPVPAKTVQDDDHRPAVRLTRLK